MKLKLTSLALTALVATMLFACKAQALEPVAEQPSESGSKVSPYQRVDGAERGAVLVKFKKGFVPNVVTRSQGGALMTGMEKVDKAASVAGATTMERVFPYNEKFEYKNRRHGLDRWYRVDFNESAAGLNRALEAYNAVSEIECVQTIHRAVLVDDSPSIPVVLDGITLHSRAGESVELPFNDPLLKDQWHYDKGAKDVPRNAGIYLFDAWRAKAGDPRILVAIVDGGVRFDHEDLVDNYWINQAEVNGQSGVDDDGNGYVDDIYGWNFVDMNNGIQYSSHGTHVAGTVAAVNNNGKGGGGVAGGTGHNDGVKIVSCQILKDGNPPASATEDNMAKAIKYGADVGAVISQNSWGLGDRQDYRSQVIEDAIDYFIAEAGDPEMFPDSPMRGGVVMFAAGNLGSSAKYYPAAYEPCITVAASDNRRLFGTYSNRGSYVDITAPGGNLDIEQYQVLSTDSKTDDNGKYTYSYKYGCSMATPHVSGVAALLVAANYGITAAELTTKLLSSVSAEPFPETGSGSGLLDASKYLSAKDDNRAPDAVTDLQVVKSEDGKSVLAQWSVPAESSTDRVEKYKLYHSSTPIGVEDIKDLTPIEITEFYWFPVGAKISYDLSKVEGLNLSAVNYFAVLASDRWGHTSSISNVAQYPTASGSTSDLSFSSAMVTGSLTVSWANDFSGPKTINVYDRSARRVMSDQVPSTETSKSINTARLATGNYTLEVVGDNDTKRRTFRKL